MANITFLYVVGIVAEILQDESDSSAERGWTEETLLDYVNLTQRRIVSLAPQANPITAIMKLASGTKQSIPSGGIALINVIRNIDTNGITPGMAITPSLKNIIAFYDLNWSIATPVQQIYNYMPSTADKTIFYNYPPSDGTGYVQLEFSQVPPIINYEEDGDWENALIGVKEQYIDALINGMLALAYKKDSDYPGNAERDATYEAAFINAITQA